MKVLIADQFEQSAREGITALGCEAVFDPAITPDTLPDALASLAPDVLVVRSKKVKASAIAAAKSLRLIIRAGAGFDTIDTAAAASAGIAVCNCPAMNAVAVAELVFGLLLACDRRIPDQTADLRAGQWNKKEYSKARGLKGLALGVVGVGSIGREVIKRAKAFEMSIWTNSLNMNLDRALDLHVRYAGRSRSELLEMLPHCDAVTIHVVANPESERMCNAEFFGAMRPGSYFINTSRGSVVDEPALLDAIRTKGLRAGLDVFDNEPGEPKTAWTSPLAACPGIYTTHHVGASTDQAQHAVADEVVRIIRVFKQSGRFENRVN